MNEKAAEQWSEISRLVGKAIHIVSGDFGMIFIERKGAVGSAMMVKDGEYELNQDLADKLKLIRDRLDSMIKHVESGQMSLGSQSNVYQHTEDDDYEDLGQLPGWK